MADKKIWDKLPRWAKIWETEASQDLLWWLIKDNLAYDTAMQEKLSDKKVAKEWAMDEALQKEVIKKLNSLLPYANDTKTLNRYKNWNPKYDNYEDDAIEKKLEKMGRNNSADLWDDVEDSALKWQPVKAVIEWGVWPYVAWAADIIHQVWNASANWYKRVYNYIANLINNKKLDDANELLDAIQEMRLAERDLADKQNKNGKQL